MADFTCHCARFAIRPSEVDAISGERAALIWAKKNLPGPDPWAQRREVEYTVHVIYPDGEEADHVVHAYLPTMPVWGIGPLEE